MPGWLRLFRAFSALLRARLPAPGARGQPGPGAWIGRCSAGGLTAWCLGSGTALASRPPDQARAVLQEEHLEAGARDPAASEARAAPRPYQGPREVLDPVPSTPQREPGTSLSAPPVLRGEVVLREGDLRVKNLYRIPVVGVGWTLENAVYAIGSTEQGRFSPQTLLVLTAGSRPLSAVLFAGGGPLVFTPGSVAHRRRGSLMQGGIGVRYLPLQRRVVHGGLELDTVFDRIAATVELGSGEERLRAEKTQDHVSFALGLRMGFTLMPPSEQRPVAWNLQVGSAVRLALARGSQLYLEDRAGGSQVSHAAAELGIFGRASGAAVVVSLGTELVYELPRAGCGRSRSRASGRRFDRKTGAGSDGGRPGPSTQGAPTAG